MTTSQVERSALWAAYGDALGFITEFRDAGTIQRRYAAAAVTEPFPWERRIGGQFGPTVQLPTGCYSDDTQLRLATSRAIRGDGAFDVEAFAKVELPILLAYHLGAGRGTKAAAQNLERKDVTWYSNFFEAKGVTYITSGGNGAAMRIQPHVWAQLGGSRDERRIGLDVLRNALTTHGHPRGFLGALFHARCLSFTCRFSRIPGPSEWLEFIAVLDEVVDLVAADEHLDRAWLPTWERLVGQSLRMAVERVQKEVREDVATTKALLGSKDPASGYHDILHRLGGFAKETVGSGTKTALAAAVLAFLHQDTHVEEALTVAANEFGSDTDTIASMAGALLGSVATYEPHIPPLDADYIRSEANRLAGIAAGKAAASFAYPDLLHWRSPKSQLDVVGVFGGAIAVAGLGPAARLGKVAMAPKQKGIGWEWLQLVFGQTILAKRRAKLAKLSQEAMPQSPLTKEQVRMAVSVEGKEVRSKPVAAQPPLEGTVQSSLFDGPGPQREEKGDRASRSLDSITSEAIRSGFSADVVGRNLIEIIDSASAPIEDAIAYAAILAKARVARTKSQRNEL